MYKHDLALNNQQWLICLKPNQKYLHFCGSSEMILGFECVHLFIFLVNILLGFPHMFFVISVQLF